MYMRVWQQRIRRITSLICDKCNRKKIRAAFDDSCNELISPLPPIVSARLLGLGTYRYITMDRIRV